MKATPTSGKAPLKVTFALTQTIPPTVAAWEVRFGDGFTSAGKNKPPASVTHTYVKGTYVVAFLVYQQQTYGFVWYTTQATVTVS